MSTAYILIPLEHDILPWLEEHQIAAPSHDGAVRGPTPAELLAAANELPGYRCSCTGPDSLSGWNLLIESSTSPDTGPWASVRVLEFKGMDLPGEMTTFEHGWPEVILPIALNLARNIAPFVIQPSSGGRPLLVARDSVLSELLSQWEGL